MNSHFELTDQEFEQKFEDLLFEPELFTHEAHLRLAWIHIRNYGIDQAIEHIRIQLLRFVDKLGARSKYNETVTVAGIRAVYHFMLQSKTENFRDFMNENSDLKKNFKELLSSHYQTDIFKSVLARLKYISPELVPFDS
jgi:hypothetical protein